MIQVCLNGARRPDAHPALDPARWADEARQAVDAGAGSVHLHPKDAAGTDSVLPERVAAAVTAVREAVGGVEVGVTTGAWSSASPQRRLAAVRGWSALPADRLPDVASVNWSEEGAGELAALLLARGVAVEAGLWSIDDAHAWKSWPDAGRCRRVLVELGERGPVPDPESAADAMLRELTDAPDVPVLLHGSGDCSWPLVRYALELGLDPRVGLEDTLKLPDGRRAPAEGANAALVAAALRFRSDIP